MKKKNSINGMPSFDSKKMKKLRNLSEIIQDSSDLCDFAGKAEIEQIVSDVIRVSPQIAKSKGIVGCPIHKDFYDNCENEESLDSCVEFGWFKIVKIPSYEYGVNKELHTDEDGCYSFIVPTSKLFDEIESFLDAQNESNS